MTASRAALPSIPANGPPTVVTFPPSSNILRNGSEFRLPHSKSFGSCAGVTFTAPVPNFMSTRIASPITGNVRSTIGCRTIRPIAAPYRGSSGWTATAVSPSIVSGRVVATTISPEPSASGYAKDHNSPFVSACTTSRSDSAVRQRGHHWISRSAR